MSCPRDLSLGLANIVMICGFPRAQVSSVEPPGLPRGAINPSFNPLWWQFQGLDLRPFLTRSDSASRERPFSTGLFFDRILLVLLLIISRVDFIVFVLFLEAVEYCCMALETRLAALCFARSSRATRASRATILRPSGLVALGSAESRQSYVRGVALSREPPKLQQA